MNLGQKLTAMAALGLLTGAAASADTLELKDGRVLQGRFLGGTQAVMRFEWNGEVKAFSVNDIVALTFTTNYHEQDNGTPPPPEDNPAPATSEDRAAPPPAQQDGAPPLPNAPAPPPAPNSPPPPRAAASTLAPTTPGTPVTLPAGQTLLIRMIDGVDSKKNNVGDVFHASLETDLLLNGTLVARRGTDVYGKLDYAKEAGHFSGSAELELQLTSMVVDGATYPLVSDDYTLKGKGRGGDTAKKVGGGAVLGAIIGGIAGGGPGAAIGAGVGGAAGAGVQVFTRGKEVKVPSETLLEFRLQQPATVNTSAR
ncbi:MAG: hypothetical protein ABSG16_21460 [Candidatus Acidiferrum sp.]